MPRLTNVDRTGLQPSKALVTLPRHGERCLVVDRRREPTACGVSRQSLVNSSIRSHREFSKIQFKSRN